MVREHSLLSTSLDRTPSRRLAKAQSAFDECTSFSTLFASKMQNVVYEFTVKSISCW